MPNLKNLPFSQLLKLRGFKEARLLCGQSGIDRLVTGITMTNDYELDDPQIKEGEFVLVSLTTIKDEGDQERLIRRISEKKASGLGIKFGPLVQELNQKTLRYADDRGFPVLEISQRSTWADLIDSVIEEAIRQGNGGSPGSSDGYRLFCRNAFRGRTLRSIVAQLSGSLERPITLVCIEGSQVISYPEEPLDHERRSCVAALLETAPSYTQQQPGHTIDGTVDFQLEQIAVGDLLVGYLIRWGGGCISAEKRLLLDQCLMTLSIQLYKKKEVKRALARFKQDMVNTLITEGFTEEYNLRKRAWDLDWKLGVYNTVILIRSVPTGGPEIRDWEGQLALNRLVGSFLHGRNLTTVPMGFDNRDNVVLILSDDESVPSCEPYTIALSLLSYLVSQKKHASFNIGVGTRKDRIEAIPDTYGEAMAALTVASTGDGSNAMDYKDIGVFRLLYLIADTPEARVFLEEYLQPIRDLDKEQNSELLLSLRLFLKHNRNFRSAAKSLNIHYNTLRYRMEHIEKKCGLDLSRPDTVLNIEIALHLDQLVRR